MIRLANRFCFFAFALLAGPLGAQVVPDSVHPPSGSPVVIGIDTLFILHGRLGPFGPAERAAAVAQRLTVLGPRLGRRQDSIVVQSFETRSELVVGDAVVMTVLDEDALPTGRPRALLATAYADRIEAWAVAMVQASTPGELVIDAIKAAAATLGLIGLLLVLRLVYRRLAEFFRGPNLPPIRIKQLELLSAARLAEALLALMRFVRVFLILILLYIYVPLVLSFFPWTAPYSARIVGYVLVPLRAFGLGVLEYLPNIFFIVVIVLVTRYALKLIHFLFQALGSGALVMEGFKASWAASTYTVVRFLVVAFALVIAWPYLPGSDTEAFKGVSLFVGVLISLGSSGAVGNVVAGLVLTYADAFQTGDRVTIGQTTGDVVDRTMLVTRLRTIKNVEVAIPNGVVLSQPVINYSSQAQRAGLTLHTTVTIGYDVPWRQVHTLLITAAQGTPAIERDPAPFVLQTSLDDFYVSYELNAMTRQPSRMALTYSELHQRIQDQFHQHGVEIMSPHYRAVRDGSAAAIPAAPTPNA